MRRVLASSLVMLLASGNFAFGQQVVGDPPKGDTAPKAEMAARGIDYVAFCPGAPERYNYAAVAPKSLVAALGRNEIPGFLERIPLDSTDLAVFRVRR